MNLSLVCYQTLNCNNFTKKFTSANVFNTAKGMYKHTEGIKTQNPNITCKGYRNNLILWRSKDRNNTHWREKTDWGIF